MRLSNKPRAHLSGLPELESYSKDVKVSQYPLVCQESGFKIPRGSYSGRLYL